jgi:hypothetical protein
MPTATNRTVDSPVKSSVQCGPKLRPVTEAEMNTWAVALFNQTASKFEFIDLDESHDYVFKVCYYFVSPEI